MTRHAALTAAIGIVIVAALLIPGVQLNPSESQAKDRPGGGDAIAGRAALASAGISAGVYKPFDILVEGPVTRPALEKIAAGVAKDPGVAGAVAPTDWQRGDAAVVEAIPAEDGAAPATKTTISRLQHDVLPKLADETELKVTLGGGAAADRDFVRAVYGNFPYVLLFVVLLTYILLARAFRSLILPLKAVILNLVSLGAAYGIIVFIFQWGHGARGDLERAVHELDHPVDPIDDLRVPLRALDGLRGLHAHADPGGVRRDGRHIAGDRARPFAHRQARDERRARAVPRVLRALDRAGDRHQAVRYRPLGRRDLRRDGDPRAARAVA